MQVSEQVVGNVVVLTAEGRVDSTSSAEFGARLDAHTGQSAHMLLDMAGVEFVSSAGLRVLLMTLKKLRTGGRTLALCNLRPPILEVLEITGFNSLLVVYPDQETALAALQG